MGRAQQIVDGVLGVGMDVDAFAGDNMHLQGFKGVERVEHDHPVRIRLQVRVKADGAVGKIVRRIGRGIGKAKRGGINVAVRRHIGAQIHGQIQNIVGAGDKEDRIVILIGGEPPRPLDILKGELVANLAFVARVQDQAIVD